MKTKMLKKNYEFQMVLNKKNIYSSECLELFVMNNKKNENYLGIAISKKVCGSVQRNRIKRLIRENYRLLEDKIVLGKSYVIIWNKKTDISKANYSKIKEDLYKVFNKANLIKEE